jgi:hypothetical protein
VLGRTGGDTVPGDGTVGVGVKTGGSDGIDGGISCAVAPLSHAAEAARTADEYHT